mmetsp:Transcript_2648/g.3610  ORF Transcript_2648/g.3610 Transcript_2648/m.3610 type:complete len:239 (-) Transcript_2648:706-1422(-)
MLLPLEDPIRRQLFNNLFKHYILRFLELSTLRQGRARGAGGFVFVPVVIGVQREHPGSDILLGEAAADAVLVHHAGGQRLFQKLLVVDLLLHGALGNKTVHHHAFLLPVPIGPEDGLEVVGGVPRDVKDDHPGGAHHVDAKTACLGGDQERPRFPRGAVESLGEVLASDGRSGPCQAEEVLTRLPVEPLDEEILHNLDGGEALYENDDFFIFDFEHVHQLHQYFSFPAVGRMPLRPRF